MFTICKDVYWVGRCAVVRFGFQPGGTVRQATAEPIAIFRSQMGWAK